MPIRAPNNDQIADLLEQIADRLEQHDDNPFRVQAFRNGAKSVRTTDTPLTKIIGEQGGEALKQIEGIGEGLASTIFEFVTTGRSSYLQQLQARQTPEETLKQVPGIGDELAQRIIKELEIDSLEALEQAAHDGRLAEVEGFGPRRIAAIRHSLGDMLRYSARRRGQQQGPEADEIRPGVALLLDVDADYRRRAQAGELPRLTPRRFNPEGKNWLPIMRTERSGWSMTVLFSNTARAHELGKTHDWVVIYYQKNGPEAQCTIVTETRGPLKDRRVIRGRERECREFYATHPQGVN